MFHHTDTPQGVKPAEESPASTEYHEDPTTFFDGVRVSKPEKVTESPTTLGDSQRKPLSDIPVPNVLLTITSVVNAGYAAPEERTTPDSEAAPFELVYYARGKTRPNGPKKAPKRKGSSGIISDPSRPTPPSVPAGTVKASAKPSRPKRDT